MDAPTYQQLVSSLPTMSKSQLTKLRQHVAFLLQHSPIDPVQPVEDEDWLLRGILTELDRRGLNVGKDFKIRRDSSYASFRAQSESVRAHLLRMVPNLTAVQRRALGEVCGRELALYLASWQSAPEINRHTMLTYVSRVPEALERSFPGYMAAGLLKMVIS